MSASLKLLPLLAAGYLAYVNSDLMSNAADAIRGIQVDATTQIEIQNIGRAVRMFYVENNALPLNDFPGFLESAMTQEDGRKTRDRTADMWGTLYRIEPRPPHGFAILSAGPDKLWGTADDLCGVFTVDDLGGAGVGTPARDGGKAGKSPASSSSSGASTNSTSRFSTGGSYKWKGWKN
ncbi:MAG: hypothetical protein PHV34_22450 [Verrucomicrobiae bacterium]|nr:hypothetical protein [Verrucomicrobiae bacterium]